MKTKNYHQFAILIFSFLTLITHSTFSQCTNGVGNTPLITDEAVWNIASYTEKNFSTDAACFTNQTTCLMQNTFSPNVIVCIKDIPYITYGKNRIYCNSVSNDGIPSCSSVVGLCDNDAGTGTQDCEVTETQYKLDLYFPSSYLIQTSKYAPVLIYIKGGAFLSSNKNDDEIVEYAKMFAARGFVVVTLDYRVGHDGVCGSDTKARAMLRAVQDVRLALRTVKAIANGDYTYTPGTDICLNLPFIDDNEIIVGGQSAGAITALMTAYYDNTDFDLAVNYNCALGSGSVCSGSSWTLDPAFVASGNNKAEYYFPDHAHDPDYDVAPIDKIKTVLSISGGVPENYNLYDGIGELDETTLPQYVADDGVDEIPAIFFHGIEDLTVEYYNSFQENIDCSPSSISTCATAFAFGGRTIYNKLTDLGTDVCARLYAEAGPWKDGSDCIIDNPGPDHNREGGHATIQDKDWIVTQTSTFVSEVICSSCTTDIDEHVKATLKSVTFNSITTGAGNIAVFNITATVKNKSTQNLTALITHFRVGVQELKVSSTGSASILVGDCYQSYDYSDEPLYPNEEETVTANLTCQVSTPISCGGTTYYARFYAGAPNEIEYFYEGPGYTNSEANRDISGPYLSDVCRLGESDEGEGIVIFPNPAASEVHINFTDNYDTRMSKLKIYDALGNISFSQETQLGNSTNDFTVDVSFFPEGIYYAVLENSLSIVTKKIMIQR